MDDGGFVVMDVTVQGDLSPSKTIGYDQATKQMNKNSDPTKGPTFAEKLMGVRNSQCEHYLQHVQNGILLSESRRMERLREDTNCVIYDYKGMEVERKRRELEEKKRRTPGVDTEDDEFELARRQRYLLYNPNQCFYMDKKNMIPLRTMARSDPYQVTPTVARARKMLQDMLNERSVEAMQEKRATMLSRKSTRSVRFVSHGTNDDDDDDDHVTSQHATDATAHRNSKTPKTKQRPKSTPHATSVHPKPEAGRSEGVMTRQEALIAYLQRSKTPLTPSQLEGLTVKELAENMPDDFTQCQPQIMSRQTSTSTTHDTAKRSNVVITDSVDGVTIQSIAKPSSGYSRRSHALSENESEFRLPSISGEMTSQVPTTTATTIAGEISESVHFGAIEQLPAHEVALLQQAKQSMPARHDRRPVKSAMVQRADTKVSVTHRRYTSTSANPIKRRQLTHAMLRQQQADVETKVDDFLTRLDSGKRKPLATRRMSMATVVFKARAQQQVAEAQGTDAAVKPHQESAGCGATTAEETPRTPRPRNPRGVPHHSQERSKRHTASFKLRRMVQELMRNRTTAQMMEYDKMRAAREAGAKTPDIRVHYE